MYRMIKMIMCPFLIKKHLNKEFGYTHLDSKSKMCIKNEYRLYEITKKTSFCYDDTLPEKLTSTLLDNHCYNHYSELGRTNTLLFSAKEDLLNFKYDDPVIHIIFDPVTGQVNHPYMYGDQGPTRFNNLDEYAMKEVAKILKENGLEEMFEMSSADKYLWEVKLKGESYGDRFGVYDVHSKVNINTLLSPESLCKL